MIPPCRWVHSFFLSFMACREAWPILPHTILGSSKLKKVLEVTVGKAGSFLPLALPPLIKGPPPHSIPPKLHELLSVERAVHINQPRSPGVHHPSPKVYTLPPPRLPTASDRLRGSHPGRQSGYTAMLPLELPLTNATATTTRAFGLAGLGHADKARKPRRMRGAQDGRCGWLRQPVCPSPILVPL